LNGLKQQWKALKEMLSTCQELAVTSDAKLLAEEQLRKRTQSDEAEIAEQRRIIAILRSELKTAREEMDEAIMKYEQQLDENRVELEGKIESKDFEIAELVALIAEMKQRLDALQISLTDTRVVALQVRNIRGELENASSEIRDLHFLLAVVQNRCLALKHENVHQKERIESLEKIIAVSNARSNALMASLEEQNKKHTETMTAKQADLQEKQLMLYDAWDRLRMSTDANTCLQEEMRQRDGL
uniref:HOOK domain-containing protein n=1 Tax=Gongylonema pulchrum TaxID=637853 RepID=A0A183EMR5_9BILA